MWMVLTRLNPCNPDPWFLLPLFSEVIPSPSPDVVRLLQQGVQQAMHWHIEATVVLDMHPATTRVRGSSPSPGDRIESVVVGVTCPFRVCCRSARSFTLRWWRAISRSIRESGRSFQRRSEKETETNTVITDKPCKNGRKRPT